MTSSSRKPHFPARSTTARTDGATSGSEASPWIDRLQEKLVRLRRFLWKHVFWTVVIFIVTVWLLDSWAVYMCERHAAHANITSFTDALWWGVVTVLTIGYGDRYPITPEGREFAGLLMVSGVACVGIITAKISSMFLEQALREGRGFVDTSKLKNHFIICGWNENMSELLNHVLDFNRDMNSHDLVIIANVPSAQVEALKSQEGLEEVQVISGDHFSEVNLRRAAPERARKALILADRSPGPNGQPPTSTEVDARTIMTAMTLSNIARGTLVTAEILDPKMDQYLKLASVSEIIYSSEYSRLLLGNASSGTGIANIIFDLLDRNAGAHITSVPIPTPLHGKPFGEMKIAFENQNPAWLVIGLLENSGNSHSIRELALRRAQQTPDMAQLVANLQGVKELRCNHPIFHPDSDRMVSEGSMAIVIAKRENHSRDENTKGGRSDVSRTQTRYAA